MLSIDIAFLGEIDELIYSKTQPSNPVDVTWDTPYNGAGYINDNIIVTKPSYYVFIKKLDNSAFTDGDKANLNNYFKIKIKV